MNTLNAAIAAKKTILVKQTTVAGEPKKNMSLAEARSKLFSSVVSSVLNKSHDHVKTVPINAPVPNKGQNMPLTSPSYVIEKNDTIRLQVINRKTQPKPQQLQQTTASTTIPSSTVQPYQKEKSVPLLLPFPSGQITIKSSRTSERPLSDADKQRLHKAMMKNKVVLNEMLPNRGRPITQSVDGSGSDDAKAKFVPKKACVELPAPLVAGAPATSNLKQLEQHYNRIQSTLGVGHMPKEVSAALIEFKQWVRIRNSIRIDHDAFR